MFNHEKLHKWWWGDSGPSNAGPLTIRQINTKLKPALDAGVVSGRSGHKVSVAGSNYAVLKFLINHCKLPDSLKTELIASANPKDGNYHFWRQRLNVKVSVNPVNALRVNGTIPSNSQSESNTVNENPLRELIAKLQKIIENGGINKDSIENAMKKLTDLGFQYDDKKFPPLKGTENFVDTSGDTPSNLAEALLWKLGKWQSYKDFAANFTKDDSEPTKQNVVFFAFARHLKYKKNPIYDQHAIRALWAICGKLTSAERKKCKTLLFDRKGKWKRGGSGAVTIACYKLFVRHINGLVSLDKSITIGLIDRLLMPLGQAIKKSTGSYDEFHQLCDWPIDA